MNVKNLPEPDFIERDIDKITRDMVRYYEEKTNKTLLPAHIERIIIDMIAYREHLVRIAIQRAAKQNLLLFAGGDHLDFLGDFIGALRKDESPAATIFKFSLKGPLAHDVIVPSGTRVGSNDGKIVFKTTQNITINHGNLFELVHGEALEKGPRGNGYAPGQIINLLDHVEFIDSVENIRETSGGSDKEEDDHYRERIRLRPEAYSMAGTTAAYTYWVKTAHQDIIDVKITSPAPCEVHVCPLIKNQQTYHEASLKNILEKISSVLNDEKIKPLGDRITIIPPEKIDFRIQVEITLYNYGDADMVKSEIEKRLSAYTIKMRGKLGEDIIRTRILTMFSEIFGVYEVKLTSPAQSIELNENQWANCLNDSDTFTADILITGYKHG